MNADEKLQLDIACLKRVIEGVECYAKLEPKELTERFRNHPEDVFCEIWNPTGEYRLMCTRDGYNAVIELAERHRGTLAVPFDFSVAEIVAGIERHLAKAILEEQEEADVLRRALDEAVADATKTHLERTYHFACVVVNQKEPKQFSIGNVTFTNAQYSDEFLQPKLDEYLHKGTNQAVAEMLARDFAHDIKEQGWVASVTIPPCNEQVAKRRAEKSIECAINILRLAFGIHYSRDMRLVHVAFARPTRSHHAITENGNFEICGSRSGSGALLADNWHVQLFEWREFWRCAAHFIRTTVEGIRAEMSYRLEDALTWFGETAFEESAGMQVVNFVAALERLTTTERFRLHNFCSRVAILGSNTDSDFEQTYWNAFEVYSARSAVMHGGFSASDGTFRKKVKLAHDITRTAIFRAFEVYEFVHTSGRNGGLDELRNFYTSQQSKWSKTLKGLETELKRLKGK